MLERAREKQQKDGLEKNGSEDDFCLTAVVNETVTAHNFKYKVQILHWAWPDVLFLATAEPRPYDVYVHVELWIT